MKAITRYVLPCTVVRVEEVIRATKTVMGEDKQPHVVEQEKLGWVAVLDTYHTIPLGKDDPKLAPGPARLVLEVEK